ncbi:hypothetical protein NMY22_g6486 [Coprinellus aureogranulatus]|nr:hypothetical protein NMY22_g6486 [Coprinellus aureogranulatus]
MASIIIHFLSTASTRLFVLRFVIVSGLAAMVYIIFSFNGEFNQAFPWALLTPALVTNIHHIGRRWMDIPLTVLETGFYIFMISWITYETSSEGVNYGFLPREVMMGIVSLWTIAISLFALLFLKVIEFIRTPKRSWFDVVDVARVPTSPWWKYPAFAIFGRKLWDPRVPGEAQWLALLRGVFSVVALSVIAAFGLYQVIILPIAENGLIPHRQFRTEILPDVLGEAEAKANWTAVVVWEERENATMAVADAVDFGWTFSNSEYSRGDPLCLKLGQIETACEVEGYKLGQAYLSNIRVSINFTELFDPEIGLGKQPAVIYNAVRVYIGLAEEADNIVATTRPIHIFPGTHLLSIVDVLVRQQIRSPALATLGFETHDTFLTVEPMYTIPNPFTNISDPNISTLSITKERRKSEWIIIQDYRNKSVLAGLSGVGGLGSFLSALLVIFLGTSLMRAVMRSKEHSPFGLLHSGMGSQMAEACQERFPALEGDIERYQKDPGIVAYLLSTLIDMAPLGFHDTGNKIERQETKVSQDLEDRFVQLPHQEGKDEETMALVPREKEGEAMEGLDSKLEKGFTESGDSDLR